MAKKSDVTIPHKSREPCLVCKSTDKTMLVHWGKNRGPLCQDHMYEELPDEPAEKPKAVKKKKEEVPSGSESATSRKSV